MYQVGRQNTGVKKAVAEWAKAAALKHNQERMAGRKVWDAKIKTSLYFAWISKYIGFYQNLESQGGGASYWLARRLILARVHEALGLDRAAHPVTGGFYSSAAPLSTQVWFPLLDIFWHESWRRLIMKLSNSNKKHIRISIWNKIMVLMQTFNYFMSLDMPVMELLGSSETGGPQTACLKVPFFLLS